MSDNIFIEIPLLKSDSPFQKKINEKIDMCACQFSWAAAHDFYDETGKQKMSEEERRYMLKASLIMTKIISIYWCGCNVSKIILEELDK